MNLEGDPELRAPGGDVDFGIEPAWSPRARDDAERCDVM